MTQYLKVKQYLLHGIQSKMWADERRIPSENELVRVCDVSRMTARRAIKELESEGHIYSIRGKGTFIASTKHQSSAVELRNIADEVRDSHNQYRCEVLTHCAVTKPELAEKLGLPTAELFYSAVIHFENGMPIQLEQRYVNPDIVPDYLTLDLTEITANEYLMQQCPAHEVSHQIEAVSANEQQVKQLQLAVDEPCLKVTRKTRYRGAVVSYATLFHPGSRYVLGTRFTLDS